MGNSHASPCVDKLSQIKEGYSSLEGFETRWKCFVNSLDVSSKNIEQLEILDCQKKQELLLNFEAKTYQNSVSEHVSFLKKFDWETLINGRRKDKGGQLRSLLSSTEISLRTNSVEWVYEFLHCEGMELLSDFMYGALQILYNLHKPRNVDASCSRNHEHSHSQDRSRLSSSRKPQLFQQSKDSFHGESETSHQSLPTNMRELINDCLHLSLRCMKTILNNKTGCERALAYNRVISLLAFSLVHPRYATKALALDILSALCLIEGGHSKVLQAFDRLRLLLGEGLRFELLLTALQHHETLDTESYCLEFSISCVQFFNIVVHSPENINLRVYLQHELYLLGLDDLLKKCRNSVDDRLRLHVDAYLDNRVDCSLLLEDAEAKETAVLELVQVHAGWKKRLGDAEVAFQKRELDLSAQAESLRGRIQQLNTTVLDRENSHRRQLTELQLALTEARSQVDQLQASLASLKAVASTYQLSAAGLPATGLASQTNSASLNNNSNESSQSETDLDRVQASLEKCASERQAYAWLATEQCPPDEEVQPNTFAIPEGLAEQSTLVRRLASEAASGLSRLIACWGGAMPGTPLLAAPVGWLHHFHLHHRQQENDRRRVSPSAYCLFNEAVVNKSLCILFTSSSSDCCSGTPGYTPSPGGTEPLLLSALVTGRRPIRAEHLSQPWSRLLPPLLADDGGDDDSVQWLIEAKLLPTGVEDILWSSPALSPDNQQSSPNQHWALYEHLSTGSADPALAQQLLSSLKSVDLTASSSTTKTQLPRLFDCLELELTRHFGSLRRPAWAFVGNHENRWFWTAAFLRISILKSLWPGELQTIIEALSRLLSGCVSVLVSTKLPLAIRLTLRLANRLLADHSSGCRCFRLQRLDSLVGWQLTATEEDCEQSGDAQTKSNIQGEESALPQPVPPRLATVSFVSLLVSLMQRTAPCLMNWPSELVQTEAASLIRIDEIRSRLADLRLLVGIWLAVQERLAVTSESCATTSGGAEQVNRQLIELTRCLESVRLVVSFTARWLMVDDDEQDSTGLDWLSPLVRFANAFSRSTASHKNQCHGLLPSSTGVDSLEPPSTSSYGCSTTTEPLSSQNLQQPQHEHRRNNKAEKLQNSGRKRRHRHRKHRTRQLDGDGIVDDILAGLTLSPLRADLHVNRKDE